MVICKERYITRQIILNVYSWRRDYGNRVEFILEGDTLSDRTYNHIAFKINDEEFDIYESRVLALGIDYKPPRPRVKGEGRSLYFYDYDNHLFELHTGTLSERLARYAR